MSLLRFGMLIAALALLAGEARAQSPPAAQGQGQAAALSAQIDLAETQLRAVRAASRAANADDDTLKAEIAAIPPIQAGLVQAAADLSQRLQNINLRLAQVGPAPTPPQAESPEISASRQQLTRQQQAVDAAVKQARLVTVEAQQLAVALTERRQQLFSQRLFKPSRSVLSPSLWFDFIAAAPGDLGKLGDAAGEEVRQFAAAAKPANVVLWIVGALAAIALLGPVRLLLGRFGYAQLARSGPDSRLRRSGLAIWLAFISAAAPLVAGLILRGMLADADALTPAVDRFAQLSIRIVTFALLFEGVGRAILSPSRPSWRLAPIPDPVVTRLAPYPGLIAFTAALASMATGANAAFGASLPTSIASDCVTLLLELAAVAAGLGALGVARHDRDHPNGDEEDGESETRWPWILAALGAWLTLACALAAVLFGYQAMASFLARGLIWTALVLAGLFLSIKFVDDLFPALLAPNSSIGRFSRIAVGLSPAVLDQVSVLLSGLCRLVLFLMAWIFVLEPFGGAAGNLYGSLSAASMVLKLGQVQISPGVIIGGATVLVVGLLITRGIRGWVEHRYLPKTRMDIGARSSLGLAISYLGGLIVILLTCAYVGVSLDKIALVASALSVGIGFGLQAVVGNFISGLILLAERPVKVGDWIAIGDLEGDVKRVNVRATEIEMADRSKLIVPNSDLISKPVRNITHGGLGRISLVLAMDAKADPAQVRQVILDQLKAHHEVLRDPAPEVYMTGLKDGALDFNAIAYVAGPRAVFRAKSDLLYAIVPALNAAGIALASSGASVTITGAPPQAGPAVGPEVKG